jgi:hypothetical protein
MSIFGTLFDWNQNGQLGALEQAQEYILLDEALKKDQAKKPQPASTAKKQEEKQKP